MISKIYFVSDCRLDFLPFESLIESAPRTSSWRKDVRDDIEMVTCAQEHDAESKPVGKERVS